MKNLIKEKMVTRRVIRNSISNGCIPISNKEDLLELRKDKYSVFAKGTQWEKFCKGGLDKSYIQTNDIDLTNIEFNPIGDTFNQFIGAYNGCNFNIINLSIEKEKEDNIGFFGVTASDACIQNINIITEGIISGNKNVGGIIGKMSNTYIFNSSFFGKVKGNRAVGSIVGDGDISSISFCNSNGELIGSKSDIGGICGKLNNTPIDNSTSYVTILGKASRAGGLVGYSYNSNLINSTVGNIDIIGESNIGGLIGLSEDTYIHFSKSKAHIKGYSNIGQICGRTVSLTKKNYEDAYIKEASSNGSLRLI